MRHDAEWQVRAVHRAQFLQVRDAPREEEGPQAAGRSDRRGAGGAAREGSATSDWARAEAAGGGGARRRRSPLRHAILWDGRSPARIHARDDAAAAHARCRRVRAGACSAEPESRSRTQGLSPRPRAAAPTPTRALEPRPDPCPCPCPALPSSPSATQPPPLRPSPAFPGRLCALSLGLTLLSSRAHAQADASPYTQPTFDTTLVHDRATEAEAREEAAKGEAARLRASLAEVTRLKWGGTLLASLEETRRPTLALTLTLRHAPSPPRPITSSSRRGRTPRKRASSYSPAAAARRPAHSQCPRSTSQCSPLLLAPGPPRPHPTNLHSNPPAPTCRTRRARIGKARTWQYRRHRRHLARRSLVFPPPIQAAVAQSLAG